MCQCKKNKHKLSLVPLSGSEIKLNKNKKGATKNHA